MAKIRIVFAVGISDSFMEVGLSQNEDCSAKGKKIQGYNLLRHKQLK
jgi:hypothetical protein